MGDCIAIRFLRNVGECLPWGAHLRRSRKQGAICFHHVLPRLGEDVGKGMRSTGSLWGYSDHMRLGSKKSYLHRCYRNLVFSEFYFRRCCGNLVFSGSFVSWRCVMRLCSGFVERGLGFINSARGFEMWLKP